MPTTITCKQCGGRHLTQQCLAASFAQTRQSAQPMPMPSSNRPRLQKDWILPQHEKLLDLLQTPASLTSQDREFVLEGIGNGPYKNTTRANALSRVVVGPGYKLYIDGQLMHHGSVWSSKNLDKRHREHVTNCVRDSSAWREKSVAAPADLVAAVVEQVIDKFGDGNMYTRKHVGKKSVKVFAKGARSCKNCDHCDAYDFLNELLGCTSQHGPREGWAGSQSQGYRTLGRPSQMNEQPNSFPDAPPMGADQAQLIVDRVHQLPERMMVNDPQGKCSISILRFKNSDLLRQTISTSGLAVRLLNQGVDIEPSWAHGAKVLFAAKPAALPSEIVSQLRPYHVLVRQHDESILEEELSSLSYKQRPKHNDDQDQHLSLKFVVENTFVHVAEPGDRSPRSTFTKSSNDAQRHYRNPRTWPLEWNSFTSAASSGAGSEKQRSIKDYFEELKLCQTRRDLPSAIQCYSSMLSEALQPDAQMFTIIIDICAKIGSCEDAERWMQTMVEKGVEPNLVTFNCVIHGYASLGNAIKAEEWFEKLSLAQLKPSLVTYNCLVQAYAKRGCIDKAEELLKTAEAKCGLNRHSYAPIIEYFAHKGLPCKAEEWFNRMGSSGVAYDRESYGMMVAAAANAKDLDGARLWADRMQSTGHTLQVYEYTQLLKACAPRDDDRTGRKLYNEASAMFHDQIRCGVMPNLFNLNALKSAVGRDRALDLCQDLSVDIEAAEREFKTMNEELGVNGWMVGRLREDGSFIRSHFDPCDYSQGQ